MSDILVDISQQYHLLRRKNPIACGEWLLNLSNQGLSQKQIAERLGANRQIIGRYLRMANWNHELKKLISQYRGQLSNTDLLKAASSPKNESMLREQIERCAKKGSGDEHEVASPNKFEWQEEKEAFLDVETHQKEELTWRILFAFIVQPTSVFLLLSIGALSGYLIHQGIIFFTSVDADNISVVASATVSEMVPLLSAACFALSRSRMRKLISLALLVCSIGGLAFFMHASLTQRHIDTSSKVSSLEKERDGILRTIDTLNESAESLPGNFISRKQNVINLISGQRVALEKIHEAIANVSNEISSPTNTILLYGSWLRIAVMLLNAIFVHALFKRLRFRV